ncbi:PHO85 cyclin-1 [Ancistrocladus abbreviatus]
MTDYCSGRGGGDDVRVLEWEVGLPRADVLTPLSQALIPPELADFRQQSESGWSNQARQGSEGGEIVESGARINELCRDSRDAGRNGGEIEGGEGDLLSISISTTNNLVCLYKDLEAEEVVMCEFGDGGACECSLPSSHTWDNDFRTLDEKGGMNVELGDEGDVYGAAQRKEEGEGTRIASPLHDSIEEHKQFPDNSISQANDEMQVNMEERYPLGAMKAQGGTKNVQQPMESILRPNQRTRQPPVKFQDYICHSAHIINLVMIQMLQKALQVRYSIPWLIMLPITIFSSPHQ